MKAEIYAIAIVAYYILGARVVAGTAWHKLMHSIDIEWRDQFWECHVLSDATWHAHLIDGQIRIGSDYRTGTEVHPFAHEIATNASLFALEPGPYRLDWSAGLLQSLHTIDIT